MKAANLKMLGYARADVPDRLIGPLNLTEEVDMNTMLSQTTGLTTRKSTRQSCSRCSGHMVHDMCIDLESDNG
jgi:hypothetical protein